MGGREMVFYQGRNRKYTKQKMWYRRRKRIILPPARRQLNTRHGTAVTGCSASHQYCNSLHAPFLHVPFIHKISPKCHCTICLVPSCQSRRAAQKARTCHQSRPPLFAQRSPSARHTVRDISGASSRVGSEREHPSPNTGF